MKFFIADPSGSFQQATERQLLDGARKVVQRRMSRGVPLASPSVARRRLTLMLAREHEVFCVAYLDTRHRLIAFEELFRGTIDGAAVYPREVVKQALHHNAAAVILAHNHPSGDAEPSRADELITQRLREGLGLIDIRPIDRFIVAGNAIVSLAERGLI
jgi:DNA repair protein RadC